MTNQDRLAAALDHVSVGVLILDRDLTVTYANRAQVERMKRLSVDRQVCDLIGSAAPVSYPLFSKDEWEGIAARSIRGGETVRWAKLPCPRSNPTSYVAVELAPLAGDNGDRPGLICVTEDVTHSVAVDRELIKKERLALVGQTGVALVHEIANPLAAILGSAEALLFAHALGPEEARRVETMKLNALRIAEIARTLRELEDLQLAEYLQGGPVFVTGEPRSS
jgi:nitrogen-specific signal transduction histidine kinase